MCRRCGERDRRGAARDRRARKRWLLNEFGDGTTVECFWGCGTKLTFATLQQDRIVPGGPYRRDNLVPSCADCNIKRTAETIPDGCYYGSVGELHTDRHGRYLDEPELPAHKRGPDAGNTDSPRTAAATVPRPRTASDTETRSTAHAAGAVDDKGLTAMHFPRPHRPDRPPARQKQPGTATGLALAEHTRSESIGADDLSPDLVVIDTTDLDELRERHPWLFTEHNQATAGEPHMERIDADLAAARRALDDADEDEGTATHVEHVVEVGDGYDAGWDR